MLHAVIDPVSNRADWIDQCEVRDDEDGQLIDLTGAVIVLAVRDRLSMANVMLAQTSDGSIVVQGMGVFGFTFPLSKMRALVGSRAYDVACTVQLNGITQQFFLGSVNVLDGIVP